MFFNQKDDAVETARNLARLGLQNQSSEILNVIRDAFDNNGHLTVPQAIDRERQKLDSIIALNVDAVDAGRIAGVSGTEFELLVAKLFEKLGFQVDATGSTLVRIAVLRPDPLMIPTTQRAWRRSRMRSGSVG